MAKMPARPNIRQILREFTVASGESFLEGAAVVLATGEISECGADPTAILGFALEPAGSLPETDKAVVALATPETTFILQGSSAPTAGDVGVLYGIVKDGDGIWTVDKTETTNTRVIVEDVHIDREEFEVRVLTANQQIPG